MKELIRATTSKDSLVLDFFASSGTVDKQSIVLTWKMEEIENSYSCQIVNLTFVKK